MMTPPKFFVALKAFIERDGKILVLREAMTYSEGTQIGKFDIPGGKLKAGERFDDALRREIFEETGLRVAIGSPFFLSEWRPTILSEQVQVVGIILKCTALDGEVILSSDHDAFEWIDPREHQKVDLIEMYHEVFDVFLRERQPLQ